MKAAILILFNISYSTISSLYGIAPIIQDDWGATPFHILGWNCTSQLEHEFIFMSSLDRRSDKEAAGITNSGSADQYVTHNLPVTSWLRAQRPALFSF